MEQLFFLKKKLINEKVYIVYNLQSLNHYFDLIG